MEKQTYKGFKVGERVILNESYHGEYLVDKGHDFIIKSFPACTIPCHYTHFVYGITDNGLNVRVFINQIVKL